MGEIIHFRRRMPDISMPETATIIELAALGKVWVKHGEVAFDGGYETSETLLFTHDDDHLHVYQQGQGRSCHLFFWLCATEIIAGDVESAEYASTEVMFQGAWTTEENQASE